MPRFSDKAKQVHDEIFYHVDILKANKIQLELQSPIDIAFGKSFIAYFYILNKLEDEFLKILSELENENKKLDDQLLQFMIYIRYCMFYMGFNSPAISIEKAEKYLKDVERLYQTIDFIDDWEKHYCYGSYYWVKAHFESFMNDDFSSAIDYQKKCIDAFSKIPEDGEYFSSMHQNNLGEYYRKIGNFEEAEKSYLRVLSVSDKHRTKYNLVALFNLSELYFDIGDLQKANKLNEQVLAIGRQLNISYTIFLSLRQKGFYLYQVGKYDETLQAHLESLEYRKQHGDPLQIFWGYYWIFDYYYNRYSTTKDTSFLDLANDTYKEIVELSKKYNDNDLVINYTDFVHALILKHGNIKKKAKAMYKLEKLIDIYPNEIKFSLNLLELLFDDVLQTDDKDTINQIEELMRQIEKVPLRSNSRAIFYYISQQILLAKYSFYIKGDPSLAFDILNSAKTRINPNKLENLVNELDAEIDVLKTAITRWDNLDISFKERISNSDFARYIKQALKVAERFNQ